MKLASVEIKGFRNIPSVVIAFDKMTVLVSENSYGKSNVMTSLDFAIDFISVPSRLRRNMMAYEGAIPFNARTANQNFSCELVFDDDGVIVKYGYEFIWKKNDESGSRIVKEWLTYKNPSESQKFTTLINRSERGFYKASLKGRCSSVISVDKDELIINKLLNMEQLFYNDWIRHINEFQVYVERHLDASHYFDIDPLILKDRDRELSIQSVDNIPRTIFYLKEKYRKKYDLLIDAFVQLFPNIIDIQVKEFDISKRHSFKVDGDAPYTVSNKVYSLYVLDKNLNQPLDFKWLSDGAKRIFLMLTYAIVADITSIDVIAFEEPENSIHPALLQNYLDILYQLSDNANILCASHSPYVLQYVNTSNIYIGKPNYEGLALFSKIDEKKVDQLLDDAIENSESVGNYIFELLSGGEDDVDILLEYLED